MKTLLATVAHSHDQTQEKTTEAQQGRELGQFQQQTQDPPTPPNAKHSSCYLGNKFSKNVLMNKATDLHHTPFLSI